MSIRLPVLCVLFALCLSQMASAAVQQIELPNGFRVLLQNDPARRVGDRLAFRLVIDVGSAHESEGERGWAHLVEHMAFLGAGRFSRDDIDVLFDQATMRHGRDLNAYTSAHHTVYSASVPGVRLDVVQDTLELMRAWIGDIHFSTQALDIEAGVVRTELLSAASHTQNAVDAAWRQWLTPDQPGLPVMPVRLDQPDADALKAFWSRHYRADRATLIVTGDFDPPAMVKRIADVFGGLAARAGEQLTQVTQRTRSESTGVRVLVQHNPQRIEPQLTLALLHARDALQLRQNVLAVEALFHIWRQSQAVAHHCGDVLREHLNLQGGNQAFFFVMLPSESAIERCTRALEHSYAASMTGLDSTGWAALRDGMVKELRGAHLYAQPSSSSQSADAAVRRVISGVPLRRTPDISASVLAYMARLSADQARAAIADGLRSLDTLVAFESADETAALPDADPLRAFAERIGASARLAVRVDVTEPQLPEVTPVGPALHFENAVIADEQRFSSGARELRLDNGVRVHHVPRDSPDNRVALMAINRNSLLAGGASAADAARALPALFELLAGPQGASRVDLRSARSAGISASVFVESARQGVVMETPSSSLEQAFSLLGNVLRPGAVPQHLTEDVLSKLRGRWNSVGSRNSRRLRAVLNQSMYRTDRAQVDIMPGLAELHGAHTAFFVNARETDVIVVGRVSAPLLRHLSRQHLGGLAKRDSEHGGTLEPQPRNQQINVATGGELADLSIHYVQSLDNGVDTDAAHLIALRATLERSLWKRLRDRDGSVYQLSVQLLRRSYSGGGASLVIHTQAQPDRVNEVMQGIDQTIQTIQTTPLTDPVLARLRSQWLQDRLSRLGTNRGVMYEFALMREHGMGFETLGGVTSALEEIDADSLCLFASRFFGNAGRVSLVLSPQVEQAAEVQTPRATWRPG